MGATRPVSVWLGQVLRGSLAILRRAVLPACPAASRRRRPAFDGGRSKAAHRSSLCSDPGEEGGAGLHRERHGPRGTRRPRRPTAAHAREPAAALTPFLIPLVVLILYRPCT